MAASPSAAHLLHKHINSAKVVSQQILSGWPPNPPLMSLATSSLDSGGPTFAKAGVDEVTCERGRFIVDSSPLGVLHISESSEIRVARNADTGEHAAAKICVPSAHAAEMVRCARLAMRALDPRATRLLTPPPPPPLCAPSGVRDRRRRCSG